MTTLLVPCRKCGNSYDAMVDADCPRCAGRIASDSNVEPARLLMVPCSRCGKTFDVLLHAVCPWCAASNAAASNPVPPEEETPRVEPAVAVETPIAVRHIYCAQCGSPLAESAKFCSACAEPVPVAIPQDPPTARQPSEPSTASATPIGVERQASAPIVRVERQASAPSWLDEPQTAGRIFIVFAVLVIAFLSWRFTSASDAKNSLERCARGEKSTYCTGQDLGVKLGFMHLDDRTSADEACGSLLKLGIAGGTGTGGFLLGETGRTVMNSSDGYQGCLDGFSSMTGK